MIEVIEPINDGVSKGRSLPSSVVALDGNTAFSDDDITRPDSGHKPGTHRDVRQAPLIAAGRYARHGLQNDREP